MNDLAWRPAQALELYNMPYWSDGYFGVNERGHVIARPHRERSSTAVDLFELAQRLPDHNLDLPVLLRFIDILHDRVDALTGAFADVIGELGYRGAYTAVYPIKVNQQRSVIEAIVRHGGERVGLEAGSKPELAAVLGMAQAGAVIVCNGYKDRAYIRRALIGQKLGHRVYIVVEKPGELGLVLEEARALDVEPLLGLRVRLASIGAGKWQNTGGEKSKFGLAATQVLEAIGTLRQAGKLDCLRMLHFHLGSQIANVGDIQRGMREAARHYVELRALEAPIDVVDVGGGLGIDYEGTRSRSYCSTNYSMQEYALNVVRTLQEVCREANQPEPDLISESGRSLTAHHAVIITSVVDRETVPGTSPGEPRAGDPQILRDLYATLSAVDSRPPLECLHDARHFLGEVQSLYTHGLLSMEHRARAEQCYYAICRSIAPRLNPRVRAHREALDELREKLAEKYFCNLSVFQSMPDVWGIDQVFPIVPIHRLDEDPSERVSLCDLTCDSDGRIDFYVDRDGVETTLPAHPLRPEEPYLLGFFLVGAYQEILGDMHNLFGDTNAVNVVLDDAGSWRLEDPEHGDRTDELLRYVHLAPEALVQAYQVKVKASGLPAAEQEALLAELEAGLSAYTYLT